MRRLAQIGLGIIIVGLALVFAYAFIDPVRAYMQAEWGPPLNAAFGTVHQSITTHWIWTEYIVPFPNQGIIFVLIFVPVIMFLWGKSKTRVRRFIFRGAAKESGFGMREEMDQPISTGTARLEATPTSSEPEKEKGET